MTNSAKVTEGAVAELGFTSGGQPQSLCPAAEGGAGQRSSELQMRCCQGNKVSSLWPRQTRSLQWGLPPPPGRDCSGQGGREGGAQARGPVQAARARRASLLRCGSLQGTASGSKVPTFSTGTSCTASLGRSGWQCHSWVTDPTCPAALAELRVS